MSAPLAPAARDLVFVDLETTGTDPRRHEILEVAALRLSPDLQTIRGSLARQVKPTRIEDASPEALRICRYSEMAWRKAVPLRAALVDLAALVDVDVVWIGHHPSFDREFVQAGAGREALPEIGPKYMVDTLSMAWPLAASGQLASLSLGALCRAYGIPTTDEHTAAADVAHVAELYAKLLGKRAPRIPTAIEGWG